MKNIETLTKQVALLRNALINISKTTDSCRLWTGMKFDYIPRQMGTIDKILRQTLDEYDAMEKEIEYDDK